MKSVFRPFLSTDGKIRDQKNYVFCPSPSVAKYSAGIRDQQTDSGVRFGFGTFSLLPELLLQVAQVTPSSCTSLFAPDSPLVGFNRKVAQMVRIE